ncbi:hypothetical protein EXS74_03050 [Candidatus Woesearchaeota archaeon]|nr:hypothetical protein [Candidatus Woesearchaeota archaeon]
MQKEIEKLLYRRYALHSKRFELLQHLDLKNYLRSARTIRVIYGLLQTEIQVNLTLIRVLQKEEFPKNIQKTFVTPICVRLQEINAVLSRERVILSQVHIFSYGYASLQRTITGKQSAFHVQLREFQKLTDKELALHQIFFDLSQKLPEKYRVSEQDVRSSWKLVLQLQNELHRLGYALGDTALVKKHGDKALVLISQIQSAEIYEFVQRDITAIKKKVEYIMAHPKENKLAYFLTTVYIVAPFTFETTGVILFFRYLGKYAFIKAKNLRKKPTKI